MSQLNEALAISIIGGADGPTSIYITNGYFWSFIITACVIVAILVLSICGFVRNRKRGNKTKTIIWGIIGLTVILAILFFAVKFFIGLSVFF